MASPDCLDPDTAASYAAGALPENERARIAKHIDGCPACRELISLVAQSAWSQTVQRADLTTVAAGRPTTGAPAPLLTRGTMVGPFEIQHALSAGGMGVVYVGFDARLDRQVALKCVLDTHGDTEQLQREAKLMAQLAHPNVVPVYDVFDAHGQVFIAMELVVGRNVRQWLADSPQRWHHIVDVYLEAAQGVAAAHRLDIVHGDVKPGNILVGDDGRVRVTDFGLARFATEAGDGVLRGTPGYFAPEQHTGTGAATVQTDQFALAVSLHEALHGALPGQPPTRDPGVPGGVRRVIARGLAKDPADRFASLDAFSGALRAARLRRWRWLVAGATVTAAVMAVSGTVAGRRAEAQLCAAAATELVGPWSPAAKDRARTAFHRTQLSYAGETLTRVEANLDTWQTRFDAARTAACEPGWFSRDVPLQRFNRQLSCLKEAARDARALVTQLEDADTAVVLHAVAASQQLQGAERCADAPREAPVAAASSPSREALKDTLAKARALAAAGRYKDALALAEQNAKAAEADGDPGLRADALAMLGGCQLLNGQQDAAAVTLPQAIRLAEAAQDDRARATAWAELIGLEYYRGHHEQVALLAGPALGATERIDDVRLKTDVMLTIGASASEKGDNAAAKAMLEQAVQLRAKAYGDRDRRTAAALSTLANAYAMNGELKDAISAHQRALSAAEVAFGEAHPETAVIQLNLGDDYLYGLQLEPAISAFTAALGTLKKANAKGLNVALCSTDLGHADLLSGKPEAALATFEEALELWATAFPQHPSRALALLGRYQALTALHRPADIADLELALKLSADLPPFEQGRVQLQLGRAVDEPKRSAQLVEAAKKNLSTAALPLIARELERATQWLAERPNR